MSLTKVTYSMISGSPANVLDFGADPTGATESTSAFTAAIAASKSVYVPTGTYLLDNVNPLSGTQIYGDGYYNTVFVQKNNSPAINIISDPVAYPAIGQIIGASVTNVGIQGRTGATDAAFGMVAQNGGAIFQTNIDIRVSGGKKGFEAFCTGNGIFFCTFRLTVIDTTDTSVLLTGGTYNEYSIFTSQNQSGVALIESTSNSVFTNLASEGQLKLNGAKNVYMNPTVELIVGSALPAGSAAIETQGNFLTLQNPTIIMDSASLAKFTYAFGPFNGGVWENPTITLLSGTLTDAFKTAFGYPWTLIGPGANAATNKIESIYVDNTSDNAKNLRTVTFVGDCSGWTNYQTAVGGATIQYTDGTPTAPTIQLRNTTTAMMLNYSATVADVYINLPYFPSNGQIISFSCNSAITTFHWNPVGGGTVNSFPSSAAANNTFSVIYYKNTNAWYLI
jgi:Pectate lyase superfamily protein